MLSLLLTLLAIPVLYSFFDDLSAMILKMFGYQPEYSIAQSKPRETILAGTAESSTTTA
jgi:hypothetical protein